MVNELINEIATWDIESLRDYVRDKMLDELANTTDENLKVEYNECFGNEE